MRCARSLSSALETARPAPFVLWSSRPMASILAYFRRPAIAKGCQASPVCAVGNRKPRANEQAPGSTGGMRRQFGSKICEISNVWSETLGEEGDASGAAGVERRRGVWHFPLVSGELREIRRFHGAAGVLVDGMDSLDRVDETRMRRERPGSKSFRGPFSAHILVAQGLRLTSGQAKRSTGVLAVRPMGKHVGFAARV